MLMRVLLLGGKGGGGGVVVVFCCFLLLPIGVLPGAAMLILSYPNESRKSLALDAVYTALLMPDAIIISITDLFKMAAPKAVFS